MGSRPLLTDSQEKELSFDRCKGSVNGSSEQRHRTAHQKAESIALWRPGGVYVYSCVMTDGRYSILSA